ncbi:hypothetical protein TI04_07835 [Achromatium sp. WMS2]|nr:hypothetical protein TI04_07835 [Achromatium sp. WMS2]
MSAIVARLDKVSLGEAVQHSNLTMYPLFGELPDALDCIVLDDALEHGCAKVTEISESGSVPELSFVNDCEQSVLLLDGEELVGAKQNRVLNLSIMVPAHTTMVIPVSCVESGRWHHTTQTFSSSGRSHYASGRRTLSASLHKNLSNYGSHASDQSDVWDDIEHKCGRMGCSSGTRASAVMYEDYEETIDDYIDALTLQPGQVGSLFLINGQAVGFDLFANPEIFNKVFTKLVHSYALDAIDLREDTLPPQELNDEPAKMLLEAVRNSPVDSYAALGAGQDLRFHTEQVTGGGLEVNGNIVHLFGFAMDVEYDTRARHSHMARSSGG